MVDEIYARMTERAAAVPTEGTFPGTGIAMVLPRVSTNSLSGLIEEVEAAPFSGKAPLSDLADSLQLQVDELLPIADVLQLLRLAEIIGPDLQLTAEGQHYAGAGVDERKQMFARALQTHVPLAQHIRRVLDERASHHAPARRFRDELEDHMTPEQAAGTLRAVTHWGRFAELFSYDEQSDMFSLDDPG
jgi:NitT/TauT family transport system ATP-binding protein